MRPSRASIRLRLLLQALGKADLFAALLLELPTETAAANRELAGLADDLRTTSLAEPIARADAHAALDLVRTAPPPRRPGAGSTRS